MNPIYTKVFAWFGLIVAVFYVTKFLLFLIWAIQIANNYPLK